jgi:hypothetical protein
MILCHFFKNEVFDALIHDRIPILEALAAPTDTGASNSPSTVLLEPWHDAVDACQPTGRYRTYTLGSTTGSAQGLARCWGC